MELAKSVEAKWLAGQEFFGAEKGFVSSRLTSKMFV